MLSLRFGVFVVGGKVCVEMDRGFPWDFCLRGVLLV